MALYITLGLDEQINILELFLYNKNLTCQTHKDALNYVPILKLSCTKLYMSAFKYIFELYYEY